MNQTGHKHVRKTILSLAALALIWLLILAAFCFAGLRDISGKADLLIIPGNTVELNGQPSLRLRARLQAGLQAWNEGCCQALFVSGGIGKEGFDEAQVMAAWLREKGVAADKIIIDSQGLTTYDTARNARQVMAQRGMRSTFIASQYFHLPRLRLALAQQGLRCEGQVYAKYVEWRDVYSLNREVVGYIAYSLRSGQ